MDFVQLEIGVDIELVIHAGFVELVTGVGLADSIGSRFCWVGNGYRFW